MSRKTGVLSWIAGLWALLKAVIMYFVPPRILRVFYVFVKYYLTIVLISHPLDFFIHADFS